MRVVAERVRKVFGRVVALDDIEFEVDARILAVLGPNGSGKTTLLAIAAGFLYPDSGRLLVNGIEPYAERDKAVKEVAAMFEKPRFPINARVRDVIKIVGELRGNVEDAMNFASELGIDEFANRKLYELSSGQAQLLGIFTVLYGFDGVVVLDEPLSHIDVARAGKLINILLKRGNVIFTTHVPEEAEALADYFVIIENGRVVWSGDRESLYSGDVYELDLVRDGAELPREVKVLYSYGKRVIAKVPDASLIKELVDRGVVAGFRRGGLRYVYARIKAGS